MNEVQALSILSSTPLLGPTKIRQLLQKFGSATASLSCSINEIENLPGFGPKLISKWGWWSRSDEWKYNLHLAKEQGVQLIPYTSPFYPKPLLEIQNFPLLLYVKGSLKESDLKSVAIVGTRNATRYGMESAFRIAETLAESGLTVVSGLARGIDTAAHKGALKKGRTLAFIGSGLGHIYPSENRHLADQIVENGALISTYPITAPPNRHHFPERNKLVSGISKGTLLVEAPIRSGAMLTMENAKEQHKKRWVLPGRCDYESFAGNHKLIKSREASLIDHAEDILADFSLTSSLSSVKNTLNLKHEEQNFLKNLPDEELNIDQIAERTKLPIMKLNVLLMGLVMKQAIKEYPGKVYKKALKG